MITRLLSTTKGSVRVTFSLPGTVLAERIHVVGDFNGWDPGATPLVFDRLGHCWRVTVELEAGGRYRFRYLLDGGEWLNDWHADDYADNPYGSFDSVLDLTGYG